jgi:heterodisulfide reductase subunit A
MDKKVVVIGGGVAGMEAAANLLSMGLDVTIMEKTARLGGHLADWTHLFPDRKPGKEVLDFLNTRVPWSSGVLLNCEVTAIEKKEDGFVILTQHHPPYQAHAVLVATGFDLFEASRKEEYGYGIYDDIITSADLEKLFSRGETILTTRGKIPGRIGFVHCVGSRDEKTGNLYCSKVCCITAVKQAIEIREKLPNAEVFSFYMDLRMYGMGFEELYKEAQEKWGITFIRGRLSEAFENQDGSIMLKVEDTLTARPLKMNVDLLVLMVGMEPSSGTRKIAQMLGLDMEASHFMKPADRHVHPNVTNIPGVFIAGSCSSPKSIADTIADARAAAMEIKKYLTPSPLSFQERGRG